MLEQSRFVLELKAFLVNQWENFGLAGSPANLSYRIRPAPLGRSPRRSRLVALWYPDDPEKPQVAAKWISDKRLAPFVAAEYRHARNLYEKNGGRFIPKPLDCPEILGIPVLLEEAVLGRSFAHQILSLPFGRKGEQARVESAYSRMYGQAETLLAGIQGPLEPLSKKEILHYIGPYVQKAAAFLSWDPPTVQKVNAHLENGIPDPVPGSGKTLIGGDFTPQNILESGKGIFLIDLEFSLESPLGFLDPLAFVYSLTRFAIPDFSREEISAAAILLKKRLLSGEEPASRLSRDFLQKRGVAVDHLPWYWAVFFIHEAVFQQFLAETLTSQLAQFLNTMILSFCTRSLSGGSFRKNRA